MCESMIFINGMRGDCLKLELKSWISQSLSRVKHKQIKLLKVCTARNAQAEEIKKAWLQTLVCLFHL